MDEADYILSMEHIVKTFPGVKAFDDVSFRVRRGEIYLIAKVLSKDAKLLIPDESTAALNESESQHLLDLIQGLESRASAREGTSRREVVELHGPPRRRPGARSADHVGR